MHICYRKNKNTNALDDRNSFKWIQASAKGQKHDCLKEVFIIAYRNSDSLLQSPHSSVNYRVKILYLSLHCIYLTATVTSRLSFYIKKHLTSLNHNVLFLIPHQRAFSKLIWQLTEPRQTKEIKRVYPNFHSMTPQTYLLAPRLGTTGLNYMNLLQLAGRTQQCYHNVIYDISDGGLFFLAEPVLLLILLVLLVDDSAATIWCVICVTCFLV